MFKKCFLIIFILICIEKYKINFCLAYLDYTRLKLKPQGAHKKIALGIHISEIFLFHYIYTSIIYILNAILLWGPVVLFLITCEQSFVTDRHLFFNI